MARQQEWHLQAVVLDGLLQLVPDCVLVKGALAPHARLSTHARLSKLPWLLAGLAELPRLSPGLSILTWLSPRLSILTWLSPRLAILSRLAPGLAILARLLSGLLAELACIKRAQFIASLAATGWHTAWAIVQAAAPLTAAAEYKPLSEQRVWVDNGQIAGPYFHPFFMPKRA